MPNQEMTPIPENIRRENAPSRESEDAFFRCGYKIGFHEGRIAGLEEAARIMDGEDNED